MKTVLLEVKLCPACGQLMLPTADQTGWFCPDCPLPPDACATLPGGRAGSPAKLAPALPAHRTLAPNAPPPPSILSAARRSHATARRENVSSPAPASGAANRVSVAGGPATGEAPGASGSQIGEGAAFEASSFIGKVLGGRYRLEAILGQGAMGTVYRAVQITLKKPFAIKVLNPSMTQDAQFDARFRQEAQIAASVRHPGLVEVFDYGVEDGLAYSVMELLEGQTLSEYLRKHEALPPEEAVRIVAAAADAVGAAHETGVVHRDLKPANIFLTRDGAGRELVKVLDFGLSKALATVLAASPPTTVNGLICGTPAYMSPEQATGRSVDARSDVYSLAVVLFRALSGAVPFEAAESLEVLYMHVGRQPPALEKCRPGVEVPAALEAVLYRALAKRPENRFRSMREFAEALRVSVSRKSDTSSSSLRPPVAASPSRPSHRPLEVTGAFPAAPSFSAAMAPVAWSRPPSKPPLAGVPAFPPEPSSIMAVAPAGSVTAEPATALPPGSPAQRRILIAAGVAIGVIGLVAVALLVANHFPRPTPSIGAVKPMVVAPPLPEPPVEAKPPVVNPQGANPKGKIPAIDDIADEPMTPSKLDRPRQVARPAPQPASRPVLARREPPKPAPAAEKARPVAKLALTSKMQGRVVAMVGSQPLDLWLNRSQLVGVPAGRLRVSFSLADAPGGCVLTIDLREGEQRSLVFGPEGNLVVALGPQGGQKLECQ
jgi:serine/threonine-protein kinase